MRAKIPSGCGVASILNSGGFNFPPRVPAVTVLPQRLGVNAACAERWIGFFVTKPIRRTLKRIGKSILVWDPPPFFPSLTSCTAHTRLSLDLHGVCHSKVSPALLQPWPFHLGDT